jgi:replicative superfamily II helicase
MAAPLYNLLPPDDEFNSDDLLGRFLQYVTGKGLTLYPAQEEAILELFEDKNVILNTPTGSGKSLVASALHFDSPARKRRSVYTYAIKALVNEKWMALCRDCQRRRLSAYSSRSTSSRSWARPAARLAARRSSSPTMRMGSPP